MTLLRFVVPFSLLVALSAAGCRQSSEAAKTSASPPPGLGHEANIQAGGVAPPAQALTRARSNAATDAAAGAALFATMNCDGCHGGGATGWVGPSLVDGRWRYGGADDEIYSSIYYGRPKGMPAYGGMLSTDAAWMLVAYLRAQPVPSVVPTTSYESAK